MRVNPNQTPITEDADQLQSIFDNQSDLTELFTEPSYDELKEVLANYLNPNSDETEETTTSTTSKETKKTETSTPKSENVEDAFDQLFNS